jgi:hypothetical protein
MRNHLRTLLAAAAVTAIAGVAYGDSPHFLSATSSVGGDDGLNYLATFKEAGLGTTITDAQYSLSLTMTVEYQCFNHGGNIPQGQPFTVGPVKGGGTGSFPVRNGSAHGTIDAEEPGIPAGTKCTGNGKFCAVGYSYTGAVLTDLTEGDSTDVPAQMAGVDFTNPPTPYLNCNVDSDQ